MKKSIATRISVVSLWVVTAMAIGLTFVMIFFMSSLTDTILLDTLQPMAKTAAMAIESNLHTLADRFFLLRDNNVFKSADATLADRQAALAHAEAGIEFAWLGIYDQSGVLLVGGEGCPHSISSRPIFPLLVQSGNMTIEDTSVEVSGLSIAMGLPLPQSDGTSHYLVGSYHQKIISDVLGNINIGTQCEPFIINAEGTLIAHKGQGRIYSQESIFTTLGDTPEVHGLVERMWQGQTGSATLSGDEGAAYVSYSPVGGTRWFLGIVTPRSGFMAPVRQAITVSCIIALAFLVGLAVVLFLAIRNTLSRPLGAITQNAHDLAAGRFDAQLPKAYTQREDEIGQLSTAFTQMSRSIHGVIQDIDDLTGTVQAGMLKRRIAVQTHKGDYEQIISGINATLDVIISHLDAIPNAIALLSSTGRPVYFNPAMDEIRRFCGATPQTPPLDHLLPVSDTVPESRRVRNLFDPNYAGEIHAFNLSIPSTDGTETRSYAVTARRIEESTRVEDICVMLILSDITQLMLAKQGAEAASVAKSSFLANMSHEMRTPMNAIIGMTSIAKSADELGRKDYCLDKIGEASSHLLGVINDILDMSKIESGKFELSNVRFDFERTLERAVNVINFKVDEKKQRLTVDIDSRIPPVLEGDDQRLSQVVTNLLSNAVKFTPEGGFVRLEAELMEKQGDLCSVRITVRDTGIGISQDQQARLFSAFEQADSGTSRKFGGTGLGLSISSHIVSMMGGQMAVESEPGEGSSFSFTVQMRQLESEGRHRLSQHLRREGLRVLAVDNEPETLMLFSRITQPLSIACDTAESAAEALTLIEKNGQYDLYFVDWRMPNTDGVSLSQQILEGNPDALIVMISGADRSDYEAAARGVGVRHFLQKPLFPSHIVDCVTECLGFDQAGPADTAADMTDCFLGHRILLAEDVAINREIVLSLLEPTGLVIDCAENGRIAVDMFCRAPADYDLIFMDVQMPELDGYGATVQIRAMDIPQAKTVPIFAMTANVFKEDVERCLQSGMNGHIGKPIDFGELMRVLYDTLQAPKKRRPQP